VCLASDVGRRAAIVDRDKRQPIFAAAKRQHVPLVAAEAGVDRLWRDQDNGGVASLDPGIDDRAPVEAEAQPGVVEQDLVVAAEPGAQIHHDAALERLLLGAVAEEQPCGPCHDAQS
jgi:hypothetical protein